MQKKVNEIKLNEYVPINDNICIDSTDQDQVYEIKFHGKPDNKFPLKNSNIEKINEKNKIKKIFLLQKGPVKKVTSPTNKDKNNGTNIRLKGINPLKVSSWVNDIEIQ